MYSFLDRVSFSDLEQYFAHYFGGSVDSRFRDLERSTAYSILFAIHGYDVLYDKRIRRLLVGTLLDEQVQSLAADVGDSKSTTRYAQELSIGAAQWRVGSKLAMRLGEIARIPLEFLPQKSLATESEEIIEPYTALPELFDYQRELVEEITHLLTSFGAGLMQLPTGAGKTRTAITALVGYLNDYPDAVKYRGIVWLAHTEELCEQAVETFQRVWRQQGRHDLRVIRCWGGRRVALERCTGAFVVASYQQGVNLFSGCKESLGDFVCAVVVDEAHRGLAPAVRGLLQPLRDDGRVSLLGLTATPGRQVDDSMENIELARLFGKNLLTSKALGEEPFETLQARGILAKVQRTVRETGLEFDFDGDDPAEDISAVQLKSLSRHQERNDIIVSLVAEEVGSGHPTLVVCCTVAHARALAALVAAKGVRSGFVDCEMRRGLRHRVVDGFRRGTITALFNYGVLSTGFDAPNIKTIIIARPTSSIVLYSQMIGRGLRGEKVGGSKDVTVIDVQDNVDRFGTVGSVYQHFNQYWL